MSWVLYPHQQAVVDQVIDAYEAGYRNVLLDAPTGWGKTHIARAVMDHYDGVFAAASLLLQGQFARDFPEIPFIQGHRNYCLDYRDHDAAFDECRYGCTYWSKADNCELPRTFTRQGHVWHLVDEHAWATTDPTLAALCSYGVAKLVARDSPQVNINPWYWMREQRGPNWFKDQPLVVVDEADALEGVADLSYHRRLATSTLTGYGWVEPADLYGTPEQVVADLRAAETEARHQHRTASEATEAAAILRSSYRSFTESTVTDRVPEAESAEHARLTKAIEEHSLLALQARADADNINSFASEADDPGMVVDWDSSAVMVRAISPGTVLAREFWPHSERRLLMSGSFVEPSTWVAWYGLKAEETKVITVNSRFPVERRTIRVWRGGPNMSGRAYSTEATVATMAQAIEGCRTGRTLVHVTSESKARALARYLPDAITYSSGRPGDRAAAVAEYLRRPDGLLIGQSLRRGLDLKDDACRTNIIAKLPFAQLDRVVRTRKRVDATYYTRTALCEVVQALGRGVRSETDWCNNYLLDGGFSAPMERMLPAHVREAIVN